MCVKIPRRFTFLDWERNNIMNNKVDWRDIKKIPNLLSVFRLVLIPACVYTFISDKYEAWVPFVIIFVSWLTDVLDGYIARHYNMITALGMILDPLADKLTQVVFLCALYSKGWVPKIIFYVLTGKEFLMLCGALFLKGKLKENVIPANKWGKTATGLFYLSVGFLLLGFDNIAIPMLYLTTAVTLGAFISYSLIVYNIAKDKKEK